MKDTIRMEIEADLSKVRLHIFTQNEYKEDYQMPMLRKNKIVGILSVDGCEVNGVGRYTYDISGLTSLKTLYEKKKIKKEDIEGIVRGLLRTAEVLRRYMLNPDNLLLQPEYIFQKEEKQFFCYLPGYEGDMNVSFHELTEYFVKMLDYEDTEGIFLAYELHKATLQEHYDLPGIMKEYEKRKKDRRAERQKVKKEKIKTQENYGNIFSLMEEEEENEEEKHKMQSYGQKKYEIYPAADSVREDAGRHSAWKKTIWHLSGKRWGQWNDLIRETDGQEEKTTL